jgi:nitrate/TMAO reductase-like tetraheme cytochrome c subunit
MSQNGGLFKRLWRRISALPALVLLVVGVFTGIIFWTGFNTTLEMTNTMGFCLSCHEMRVNPYPEYQETIHYKNPSGVQVTCADCHVPRPWGHKVVRKVMATKELWYKFTGKIDTPEKYNEHRWELANRVWDSMKATDSRECRNCHTFDSMDLSEQDRSARKKHSRAIDEGETCIDCHKGIAHELPDEPEEDEESEHASR